MMNLEDGLTKVATGSPVERQLKKKFVTDMMTGELTSHAREESFLVALAVSLHRYGTSSHELEQILQTCAERLDLNAAFFSTPTAIFISFPESLENPTILKRVSPGSIDLEKLVGVDRIVSLFLAEKMTIDEATRELEIIDGLPGSFSP